MNEVCEGIARADAGASEAWKETALSVVKHVAGRKQHFTTDDVWETLFWAADAPANASALGPVMLRAKREGIIQATGGYRDSQRHGTVGRANYGKPIRVWKSLVFAQEAVA